MARPYKYDLQYFPLDVHFFEDHKLLMIEEDYGLKGGYIAIRLLSMVYEQGYYLNWNDRQELSIAKRMGNGIAGALVLDVLRSCLKHGLFDINLFERHKVLSSKGIQKRWFQVMVQLRRKPEINVDFWLVSSEETPLPTTLTHLPDTFSTQKEKKVNEIKVNVAAHKPPLTAKSDAQKTAELEPFWQELVQVWLAFGLEKFKVKPSFEGDDPKIFRRIIHRLKFRTDENKTEWNIISATSSLKLFLESAYADKWLSTNFLLSNLERQFDKFIQKQAASTKTVPPISDLEYLYQRFLEGKLDSRLIHPEHFIELQEKKGIIITPPLIKLRMSELLGNNKFSEYQLYQDYEKGRETKAVLEDKPNLQRLAVLEYFGKIKKSGIPPVD